VETAPIIPILSTTITQSSSASPLPVRALSPGAKHNKLLPPNNISSDEEPRINFAHFAYTGSGPNAGPSRAGSSRSVAAEEKPTRKKRPATTRRISSDFSNAELAKLSKCVSCEINWTARKTAAQKMLHIQSCAKKNFFTDETIRVLIRKQIDVAMTQVKGKGKAPAPPTEPADPRTFYEDIVTDAGPKKKGRRLKTKETVKNVAVARNIILDRARAVLGLQGDHSADGDVRLVHTQSIGRSILGRDNMLPATQAFGRSALGQSHLKHPNDILLGPSGLLEREESESDEGAPPTTQTFAPSKLCGISRTAQNQSPQHPQRNYETPGSQILSQSDLIKRPFINVSTTFLRSGI
jgi:hypothetical protein